MQSRTRLLEASVSGPESAIWDDDEWVSWHEINRHIELQELSEQYPNGDASLVPIFESLLAAAEEYHRLTGRHLQVYGDIGELFASLALGMTLHRNYAKGSDGRLGNDYIEVKTITPFNRSERVSVALDGHFSKLFVVKVTKDFEVFGRLVGRRQLPKRKKRVSLSWDDLESMGA